MYDIFIAKSHVSHYIRTIRNSIIYQPIELENCSNPQKMQVFQFRWNTFESFGFCFFCGWHHSK